ncbi:response regulator transcription factor [Massilia sp. H-1]|nr:response regulator transcription factor [Massilia sp. H-1]
MVLLDVRMPACSGIELLRRQVPGLPPAILLTTFDDDEALFDGMRAAARGFLLKDISLERLADAIRHVHAAWHHVPSGADRTHARLLRTRGGRRALPLASGLTERETEILALMATGFNNAEIAAALGPSEGTVKNHVSSILSKLGVRDRLRAVLRALELGYI